MAYSTSNPPRLLLPSKDGVAPAIWSYISADVHTDVDATDYFTNAVNIGMKVGDIVYVAESDNSYATTLHSVAAIDTDGNATISAAVLA